MTAFFNDLPFSEPDPDDDPLGIEQALWDNTPLGLDDDPDPEEWDGYDDDGYYDDDDSRDDDGYLDDDGGYFDFYTEAEDIIEGETYGRYIGPGSDTLPESDAIPVVWVNGLEAEPVIDTFTCDGCGEAVTVWCSRCYCGECCCKCAHDDEEGDDGNAPKPNEPPPGRWNMPLAAYVLI